MRDYVFLQGGLGNQLYQLNYAHYLRQSFGRSGVRVFFPRGEKGDTQDRRKRNVFDDLVYELGYEVRESDATTLRKLGRVTKKLAFVGKMLHRRWIEAEGLHAVHQAPGVYTPPYVGAIINEHRGYYQSYKYVDLDYVAKIYQILRAKAPELPISPNFSDVAIHLRRGDFVASDVTHIYRCFGAEHYLQGLALLGKEQAIGRVYVFSDDFDAIVPELEAIGREYELVPVRGLSVVGDIVQMSMFSRFVLANSTFSWWAAFMAMTRESVRVVVPSRPLHYHHEGECYYPDEWTKI